MASKETIWKGIKIVCQNCGKNRHFTRDCHKKNQVMPRCKDDIQSTDELMMDSKDEIGKDDEEKEIEMATQEENARRRNDKCRIKW